ncbi:MAG: hypothetical protein Q9226_002693 [Calogaya cf. arnoldii]
MPLKWSRRPTENPPLDPRHKLRFGIINLAGKGIAKPSIELPRDHPFYTTGTENWILIQIVTPNELESSYSILGFCFNTFLATTTETPRFPCGKVSASSKGQRKKAVNIWIADDDKAYAEAQAIRAWQALKGKDAEEKRMGKADTEGGKEQNAGNGGQDTEGG